MRSFIEHVARKWRSEALALPSYHRGAAQDAINAELVRLTLPHHPSTDRPELRP